MTFETGWRIPKNISFITFSDKTFTFNNILNFQKKNKAFTTTY